MRKMAAVVGVLALFAAGTLWADEVTKRTAITVNEPVMVAGFPVVTLEPGNYVLRLMNHDHNRNIVQIFNDRENKLYTTVLAINNYRLFPTDKTVLRFYETPVGNPIALRAWFAPGDHWGQEFVYPKGLAVRIARETGTPVPVTAAQAPAELATAPLAEVTKEGVEEPLPAEYKEPEVVAALEPTAPAAEAAPTAAVEPVPEIPVTATPFFTIGLLGLGLSGAGLGLKRLVR